MAGGGATLEGGQIDGTLLSAPVSNPFLFIGPGEQPFFYWQIQLSLKSSYLHINMVIEGPFGGSRGVQNYLWRGPLSGKG